MSGLFGYELKTIYKRRHLGGNSNMFMLD